MTELASLIQLAESLWPQELADDWDAPGLVSGSPQQEISNCLLTVDVTLEVLDEAIERDCQLIFAHHPYLLRGVHSVSEDSHKGKLLSQAIKKGVAIFAAHTNADIVENGVSDRLAKLLDLQDIRPLIPSSNPEIGHGRIGFMPAPIKLGDLAVALGRLLPPTATGIRASGEYSQTVQKIALCAGAGDSFIASAIREEVDVYITSDLRHHPVQDARETRRETGIIDISHWAAESLWLETAAAQLASVEASVHWVISDIRTDPWDFTVTQ